MITDINEETMGKYISITRETSFRYMNFQGCLTMKEEFEILKPTT
jgi:hypothetical protein